MLRNNMDKYFKEQLESARFDWDKEAMWDDILTGLPDKKRRIIWWPWLLGLFVLAISIALMIYNYQNRSIQRNTEVAKLSEDLADSNTHREFDNIELAASRNEIIIDPNYAKAVNVHSGSDKDNSTDHAILNNIGNSNNRYSQIESNTGVREMNKIKSRKAPDAFGNGSEMKSAQWTSDSRIKRSIIPEPDKISAIAQNILLDSEVPYISPELLRNHTSFIIPKKEKDLLTFRTLSAVAGIGTLSRNFKTSANNEIFSLRSNSEKTLETWHAGIMASFYVGRNIFLQSGVEYRVINERMNYTETESNNIIAVVDTAAYYQSYTGTRQFVSAEVELTQLSSRDNLLYNSFLQVNTPVYVGYELKRGALALSIVTGPVFGLVNRYRGGAIQADGSLKRNVIMSANNSSILSSFDFGLQADVFLNRSASLTIGLNYRKALSNMTIDDLNDQHYDILETKFGLNINI